MGAVKRNRDYLNALWVKQEELKRPEPSEAVLLACDLVLRLNPPQLEAWHYKEPKENTND